MLNPYIDLINFLANAKDDEIIFLTSLLVVILVVSSLDFLFGWTNAKFNDEVVFQSNLALYGIIKKMFYFITLVIFLFIALLIAPYQVAIASLTVLYLGYLLSELNSIFSHLGLTDDGKEGSLFIDFLDNIFKKGGK